MFLGLEIMPKMHGDTALFFKLILYFFFILAIFKLTKTMPSVNIQLSLLSPFISY